MKPVAVVYATREGHTTRIADAVARGLNKRGLEASVVELGRHPTAEHLDRYGAVVLASPVHAGRHAPEAVAFVKAHRSELERMPTAFLSVTLSEAGVERSDTTPEEHAKFVADVASMNEHFFEQTGWHPARVENVAGALAYRQYNFLIRFVMKRIAKQSGGSTDTSRDHDYTDWVALDRFVATLAEDMLAEAAPEAAR
jgi:menaquinone-dependent protoporphyrinogen oxidase